MKKKKTDVDHAGFRNGDLFCYHCGRSYKMQLPQPLTMAAALMKQFAEDHKDCTKTWVEPVNTDAANKSETENARWWAENGERGMSSEAMFNCLARGLHVRAFRTDDFKPNINHPGDPNDFSRCYKLLNAVPQWKEKDKLERLNELSEVWVKLVDNWDKLTAMLEELIAGKSNDMYETMKTLGC